MIRLTQAGVSSPSAGLAKDRERERERDLGAVTGAVTTVTLLMVTGFKKEKKRGGQQFYRFKALIWTTDSWSSTISLTSLIYLTVP